MINHLAVCSVTLARRDKRSNAFNRLVVFAAVQKTVLLKSLWRRLIPLALPELIRRLTLDITPKNKKEKHNGNMSEFFIFLLKEAASR